METSDELAYNLIKVYVAQMDSALKISKKICEHSERTELTGDDIICGLVYRLMKPMTQEEINQSLQFAENILEGSSSEEECEEDYDKIDEVYQIPKVSRKIKSNNCNCDICSEVRVCLANYNDFEASDQLSQRFKDSINETCKTHKIYI
tara:strand:- start:778 stop:1224 length:447 start_codon:yes stop_codon:yes gene_type:complete